MLVTLGAGDVHANEIESRRIKVFVFCMSLQVNCLFLEILAQSLVSWRWIGDMPRRRSTDHSQRFRTLFDLIEFVQREPL